MELTQNHRQALLAALAIGGLTVCGLGTIFGPIWRGADESGERSLQALSETQYFLEQKQKIEENWNLNKRYSNRGVTVDEVVNQWMKELLTYAQSQSIQIDKIEPAGIREKESGQGLLLFVSFQTDIKKLTAFLYFLAESDPLTGIQSLVVRKEDDPRRLLAEIILRKERI